MSTPASIAKHPIHPMIVVLPMGLWIFSLVADLIAFIGWRTPWHEVALYTMAGGVVGAFIAAVPGLIDLFSIKEKKSRGLAVYHLIVNLLATVLFAFNVYLRATRDLGDILPLSLSIAAIALMGIGGWLGGELVYVHGVGVDPGRPRPNTDNVRDFQRRKLRRIV
jgi:uncharacterized membrane protein